jgi:hypothetical protein
MNVAGWIGWILALIAIAAFVVVFVYYIRQPKDEKLLRAIGEANTARTNAELRERQYNNMVDGLRREVESVKKIKDERKRLEALASLGNRFRRR